MAAIGTPKADRLVREFMALGFESFQPSGLPNFQEDLNVLYDAMSFYSAIGELYYKVSVLLAYAGYPEAPVVYFNPMFALMDTGGRLIKFKIEPEEKREYVMRTYEKIANEFSSSSLLLSAPEVLPTRGRGVPSVQKVLKYTYLGADVLFHLVRIGGAAAYLDSGFAIPGLMDAPHTDVCRAFDCMLSAYKEAVGKLVLSGC